ncbi:GNAT family N-acetyltransferase [Demetria terragena]|uniref:GNAT family N-acetyltransferase n=1 Tax=Demetria terragena TaxID=63959 RepID=UPI00037D17EE|nr:GNAT family N-acetyltransferase [Demetria terragena]
MSDNEFPGFTLFTIRPLLIEDADKLGALHVEVWREAYAGLMPAESLRRQDPAVRAERWRGLAVEQAEGLADAAGKSTRVAVHPEGMLAGFATVAPSRDNDPPVPLELWALNVDSKFHGTGAAGQLLAATLGDRAAHLWVLQGNERAIAFYRKHGFELDGETRWDDDHGVTDLQMVRS